MWHLFWGIPAILAIAVIWTVSAIANYQFGLTQGTADPIDLFLFVTTSAHVNGMASLAVDLLKTLMPAAFLVCVAMKKWGSALGTAACFGLCLIFSASNSVGYVLTSHFSATDSRGQTADQWNALTKSIADAEKSLGMVPEHRPASVVSAAVDSAKADSRFARTAGCSGELTGAVNFCREYRGLLAEQAAANSAVALNKQLSDLRSQLDTRKKVSAPDALSAAGALFGIGSTNAAGARSLYMAVLLEFISSVMLAIVCGIIATAWMNERAAKAARATQKPVEPAETAPVIETPAEAPVAILPDPAVVRAAITPKTPPTSGTRKPAPKPEPVEEPADARGLVLKLNRELPSYASDVFEESAPPARRRVTDQQAARKKEARRSAQQWLAERTAPEDRQYLPVDSAWISYCEMCKEQGIKRLPKHTFETAVAGQGVKSCKFAGQGKHFVGISLAQPKEEKRRAVA